MAIAFFNNPTDPNKPTTGFSFGQQATQSNPATSVQSNVPAQQQQSMFGSNVPTGSLSGGAGLFGQQSGTAAGQQSAFGGQSAGTAFGSPATSTPAGAFGSTNASTNTASTPSLFGSGVTNPPSAFGGGTSSAFGGITANPIPASTSTPPAHQTFGAFGSTPGFGMTSSTPSTAPAPPSIFGLGPQPSTTTATGTTTPAAKPAFGLGSTTTTTPFGAPPQLSQAESKPAEANTTFSFGTAAATGEQMSGFGGFGRQQQTSTQPSSETVQNLQSVETKPIFGGFGQTQTSQNTASDKPAPPAPSLGGFGQPSTEAQPTEQKSTFGGFAAPLPATPASQSVQTVQGGDAKPVFGGFGQSMDMQKSISPAAGFGGFGTQSTVTSQPAEQKPAFGGFGKSITPQPIQPPVGFSTFEQKPTPSTDSKSAFGTFGQSAPSTARTTPDNSTERKPAFGGFVTAPAAIEKPAEQTPVFALGATTTAATSSEQKSTFPGFPPSQLAAIDKPVESKLTFGAIVPSQTPTTDKSTDPKSTFGVFGQTQTSTTDKTAEPKPVLGGFGTSQPPERDVVTDSRPTFDLSQSKQPEKPPESKPFGFSSVPGSGTSTPRPPEPSGFGGFKLDDQNLSAGTSTAATSGSGDSTSTTPAPVRKDFGAFRWTPTGTPQPEDKKEGFALLGKDEKEDKPPIDVFKKKEEEPCKEAKEVTALQAMKNKTLDEIINKWTGELDRCGEQFKVQADDIRKWDAILVENGDKIANLYTATLEATQAQDRIDTALTYIEGSQIELSSLLDHYEEVVRDCFEQLGGRETMQPADQEREKMYSLAENVNSELDECVKGLGGMIKEINAAAQGGGGGDLLGEVVKVLNEQLVSLGWIDEVSSKVEEKISKLEREARGMSEGFGG